MAGFLFVALLLSRPGFVEHLVIEKMLFLDLGHGHLWWPGKLPHEDVPEA